MDADRWVRVEELCQAALERPEEQQTTFLESACGPDQELRREVESLLAHRQRAENFIEGRAMDVVARALAAEHGSIGSEPSRFVGRLVSHYRIVEKIASGGMGDVYRAVRADGSYDKQVAIKIIQGARSTEFFLARFQNERQILATLDHPNIARLLDGGTTEEGLPYVVMEFIRGVPIDEFCEQEDLDVNARLTLFRSVCSAVQYAHQNLVVHRDLKPSNILVTAEGIPKLLDFGIAKILDPLHGEGASQQTVTLMRLLTPDTASPEQVRNEPISTSSDVYSLGVILYKLLTGHHPYRLKTDSPQELMRAICEIEPQRPSTVVLRAEASDGTPREEVSASVQPSRHQKPSKLAKILRGDLDNITLKALRKEPHRRYSSVEQFSDDLRRYMAGLPVCAHKDTVGYRAAKFVSRHKLGVAAAVVVAVGALAGVAAIVYEGRIARAHQLRAEQRFNDVRKLANSLIFQIHDAVQSLPGSTPTRKLILDQALEYLDSLAEESAGDASLQRELASAYTRVATLQGIASESNLGQGEAGLISFRKALAIREAIATANPTNTKDELELAAAHRLMARMLATSGKSGASDQNEQAIAITARLSPAEPGNPDILKERAVEFELAGDMQDDPTTAIGDYRSSLSISLQQLRENPQDKRLQLGVALISTKMGGQLAQLDSRNEALQINQTALDALQPLAKDQTNTRYSRELAFAWAFRGQILLGNGDAPAALSANRHALQIAEGLAKTDPQNMALQLDVAAYSSGEGLSLVQDGKYGEGEMSLSRSIQIYEDKLAFNHADTEIPWLLGHNLIWIGEASLRQGKTEKAEEWYRKSIATLGTLKGSASNASIQGDLAAAHLQLGEALSRMGNAPAALSQFQAALMIAEPLAATNPPNHAALYTEADAYFGLGQLTRNGTAASMAVLNRPGDQLARACDWYRKSADAWRRIPNPGAVSSSLKPCGSPKQVAMQLARCNGTVIKLTRSTR